MPVLIQSDIFVEFLTNGETATQIQEICQLIRDGELQAYVTETTLTRVFSEMREKKALEFILFELPFHVCRNNNDILNLAYELMIDDFEIALNVAYALQLKLTIITQNNHSLSQSLLTNYPQVRIRSAPDFLIEKNCSQLGNLLRQRNFHAANQETIRVLQRAANENDTCQITIPVLKKIPHEYLRLINQYWLEASGGKFGFSTQKTIWHQVKSNPNFRETVTQFFAQVRWEWAEEKRSVTQREIPSGVEMPMGYFPLAIANLNNLTGFFFVLDDLFSHNFD
ncbi:MAG: GUN4 domain-containing protein [Gomphosphaeria aponina SAG 52.96 = DSM 107014]|uniref:GUN4 domain-containing protein n=1 Tax=Gomphosphaeria aponina SAG 52.96 = DSM 107014 TaxID=1521640 RepID=A0A941GV82_9CHRO|nr:GUN4 domain-containing protein [Gomphosphaeria aponina SAG 52.96 = DSM 107014]